MTQNLQNNQQKFLQSNDVQGWNGTRGIFLDLISSILPTTIIEVGSWHGQSAITMAHAVKHLELSTKIYCVDTWLGALEFMGKTGDRDLQLKDGYPQIYYTFLENIRSAGVEDIIIPIPQTAHIASLWFKQQGITAEMIYIDAAHDYYSVTQDVTAYLPLCTNTIFGDDYMNRDFEVKQAINDLKLDIELVDNNFWLYAI